MIMMSSVDILNKHINSMEFGFSGNSEISPSGSCCLKINYHSKSLASFRVIKIIRDISIQLIY